MLLNEIHLTNYYSVFVIDLFEKMVNLRLSFYEVFDSNFNTLNTVCQFSLKIAMHYQKTMF